MPGYCKTDLVDFTGISNSNNCPGGVRNMYGARYKVTFSTKYVGTYEF